MQRGTTTRERHRVNDIDTVFFDFDGTLVFHEPDSFDVISVFCAQIGQPLDEEAERMGRRTRYEYFVDPLLREHLSGLSPEEFWHHFNRHLLKAIGIEGDLDRLAREVTTQFADVELVYYCPDVGLETVTALRDRGYGVGLITNRENVERFHHLLDLLDLWDYFDLTLASGEVGISKPEPGIFAFALERMGAAAANSVYVGDNYWADVIGAQNAGLTPILFDPHHLFPEAEGLVLECIPSLLEWLA
jgi:putative hydrolase of the HAD superfamily